MGIFEAIVLGIIQGLSEFLPISSTAHLTLAGHLFGVLDATNPERWTAFIATIQMGTLIAVLLYYARDIIDIPTAFLKENFRGKRQALAQQSENSRMGWFIILGSVPIVIVALLMKKVIEGEFTKDPLVIALSLIILAIILFFAEKYGKFSKDSSKITIKDAILIGAAQCLALVPGASRSGTTMTAGLFLGLKRDTAAKFSFLLSIPAVFGSGMLEFVQSLKYLQYSDLVAVSVATIAAAISGYAAIAFLMRFLKKNTTYPFVIYRIVLGAIIIFTLMS